MFGPIRSMSIAVRLCVVAAIASVGTGSVLAQFHGARDQYVTRCLDGSKNLKIDDLPFKNYCVNLQHGSMNGPWFGDRESEWVQTLTQTEWSRKAAKELACTRKRDDEVKAVNLIAACNCDNKDTVDYLRSEPSYALKLMRVWANCD